MRTRAKGNMSLRDRARREHIASDMLCSIVMSDHEPLGPPVFPATRPLVVVVGDSGDPGLETTVADDLLEELPDVLPTPFTAGPPFT